MIFAPDFVRLAGIIFQWVLCIGVVGGTYGSMRLLQKLDKEAVGNRRVTCAVEICLCLLCGEVVWGLGEADVLGACSVEKVMVLAVFAGCLLAACIMDVEGQMIYNYVWWVACPTAGILLYFRDSEISLGFLLYVLLQEVFFARLYGRADCHAFVACAMVESALGMKMKEYLTHMLLAYVFLAIVQGFKQNIGRNGNLKKPVAFLPYITVSFWVLISLGKSDIFIRV